MFGTLLKEKRAEPLKKLKYGDKVKNLQNKKKNLEVKSKDVYNQVDMRITRRGFGRTSEQKVPDFKPIKEGGSGTLYTYKEKNRREEFSLPYWMRDSDEPKDSGRFVLKQIDTKSAHRQYRNLLHLEKENLCDSFLCPKGYFHNPNKLDVKYIKLEYLEEYETLEECYMNRRSISLEDWNSLKNKLVDIVKKLHEKDVIHNDIKPQNIMIKIDGNGSMTQKFKFIDAGSLMIMGKDSLFVDREEFDIPESILYLNPEFKNVYYHYFKFDTFTPTFIDFQIFLPHLFKKWKNSKYKIVFMDVEYFYNDAYNLSNIDNNVSITKNYLSYTYDKKKYSINLNFDYNDPMKSFDTRKKLIDLLKNNIYIIDYWTYIDGKEEKFNRIMEKEKFDQLQKAFTDAETDKKVSNIRENEYLIRPRPIFYSMFDEYYDLERFKMNDMNAIKLTNVLVEYMLFKNPIPSETYQSQDSQYSQYSQYSQDSQKTLVQQYKKPSSFQSLSNTTLEYQNTLPKQRKKSQKVPTLKNTTKNQAFDFNPMHYILGDKKLQDFNVQQSKYLQNAETKKQKRQVYKDLGEAQRGLRDLKNNPKLKKEREYMAELPSLKSTMEITEKLKKEAAMFRKKPKENTQNRQQKSKNQPIIQTQRKTGIPSQKQTGTQTQKQTKKKSGLVLPSKLTDIFMNKNYEGLIEGQSDNPQINQTKTRINKKAEQIYKSPTLVKARDDRQKLLKQLDEDMKKNKQEVEKMKQMSKLFRKK